MNSILQKVIIIPLILMLAGNSALAQSGSEKYITAVYYCDSTGEITKVDQMPYDLFLSEFAHLENDPGLLGIIFLELENYTVEEIERISSEPWNFVVDLKTGEIVEEPGPAAAVTYVIATGQIVGLTRAYPPWLLRGILVMPGQALHLLENYTEEEINDIWYNPEKYIFDRQLGRIRVSTYEERKAIYEMYISILRSMEVLPDGLTIAELEWLYYAMIVETNSEIRSARINPVKKQIVIEIWGEDGTSGVMDLVVPLDMIDKPDEVTVHLDGNPIDFRLTQVENNYLISVEYTHSLRVLTFNLIALPAWYTLPLNLALITLAIVAALGALYWFRFRR